MATFVIEFWFQIKIGVQMQWREKTSFTGSTAIFLRPTYSNVPTLVMKVNGHYLGIPDREPISRIQSV